MTPINDYILSSGDNIVVKNVKKEKYDNAYSLEIELPNLELIEN